MNMDLLMTSVKKVENVHANKTLLETNVMDVLKDSLDSQNVKDVLAMTKDQKIQSVTLLENVLAKLILLVTAVTVVTQECMDSPTAKVS